MAILSTGSTGAEVKILQRSLLFLGYAVTVNGNFDADTDAAVTKFQQDQNLGIDGQTGPQTWGKLDYLVPQGIDISHHNKGIDLNELSPHIQFVYCKASQGSGFADPNFKMNIGLLRKQQIICGAYHFLTFQSTAVQQALNFMASGFDFSAAGSLPPAVDIEWQVGNNQQETDLLNQYIRDNQAACIQLASDFLQLVAQKTGRTPVVYTAKGFMEEFLANSTAFADYPLWIPAYQKKPPGLPRGWNNYIIWQYFGAPDGSAGVTDQNIFNGNLDDLKNFTT